ncbi:MAG TPA: phosphoglycerate dehydrogenase [Lautropia sp.]|nr:phosphoglycerate dehydrogenase [Lautropia sp.]
MAEAAASSAGALALASARFRILVLNQIAASGLERFPKDRYEIGKSLDAPDAIMVRSADLHGAVIGKSVKAVGRAGAGTNNIPVKAMSARGVPVFNAPGANANAVKELVLAGMLMASRHLPAANRFVESLDPSMPDLEARIEDGKKQFGGRELAGKTAGVIGLGRIGCLVADAAIRLGMQVVGFDPSITVEAAWSLPSQVQRAGSVADLVRRCDFISVHVPLVDETRHLIDATQLTQVRPGAVLLNFSRDAVVDVRAVLGALESGRLSCYVCDFPESSLIGHPQVIALPHLGASTQEAEENCAVMIADQLRDYLEHGNIRHSVNFPEAVAPRESAYRVAIANANVPNMLGQISTAMAAAGLNIHTMLNKSRGEMAYTIVDVDSPVPAAVVAAISSIDGVLAVRYLAAGA